MSITTEDYKAIAEAMLAKGLTPKKAYKILKKSGFKIKLKSTGKTYSKVYASRVLALMYEAGGEDGDVPEF